MTEIDLDITQEELHSIVSHIATSFSEESKSYIVGDNLLEELGHAVFNEYVVDATNKAFECMTKPRYTAHTNGECPVPAHTTVEVVLHVWGLSAHVTADMLDWGRESTSAPGDIIAYRLVSY